MFINLKIILFFLNYCKNKWKESKSAIASTFLPSLSLNLQSRSQRAKEPIFCFKLETIKVERLVWAGGGGCGCADNMNEAPPAHILLHSTSQWWPRRLLGDGRHYELKSSSSWAALAEGAKVRALVTPRGRPQVPQTRTCWPWPAGRLRGGGRPWMGS